MKVSIDSGIGQVKVMKKRITYSLIVANLLFKVNKGKTDVR